MLKRQYRIPQIFPKEEKTKKTRENSPLMMRSVFAWFVLGYKQLAQGCIASMCCLPKLGLWRFMFLSLVILAMTVLSLYDNDKFELTPVMVLGVHLGF